MSLRTLIETALCRMGAALAPLSLSLLPALSPALAHANSWVACSTQSNGYTFRNADYGADAARSRVVTDCQRNAATNNGQCRYNVTCDGPGLNFYSRCTAESNGYRFLDGGADPYQALASVIEQCTKHAATNNGQCRYSAGCEGLDPRSITRCESRSNGYIFRDADLDGRLAMDRTLQACEKNAATNNGQCRASLGCSGGGPIPGTGPIVRPAPPVGPGPVVRPPSPVPGTVVATCTTSVAGLLFRVTGVTFRETRARVVAECERSVRLSDRPACQRNSDCR